MKKLWVIFKAAIIVIILVTIKLVLDHFTLDVIGPNPIITSLVAGVIFTLAILFSGVLADYKESEKIPGELAMSVRNLYKDIKVATITHKELTADMQAHIGQLLHIINANFRRNEWKIHEINREIDKIDEDIEHLAADGIAPAFITKIRTEISNVEKISYRIDTIMETNFLPAAYAIAVIATCGVIGTLLFTKMDPYYEALALFGTAAFVLISILALIKDMDNPFQFGKQSSANVDLSILFKLEEYLKN
jgi:hypothetical protein